MPYTILRDNSYYSNIAALLAQAKESGTLPFPGITAKVAYVDHKDVAGALAGALLDEGHANKIYEISGADAYSAHRSRRAAQRGARGAR